jgi:hypothetical protein
MSVMLVASAKLIARPNTIVSDKIVTWMIVPVTLVVSGMLVVPPKLITRPNTYVCALECYRVGDVGRVSETDNSR